MLLNRIYTAALRSLLKLGRLFLMGALLSGILAPSIYYFSAEEWLTVDQESKTDAEESEENNKDEKKESEGKERFFQDSSQYHYWNSGHQLQLRETLAFQPTHANDVLTPPPERSKRLNRLS